MEEDERIRTVRDLLFSHVSTRSQRRMRDAWSIHLLAKEIVDKLDHRDGMWRKWNEPREVLVKSATDCWIPIEELREYLNGMPGPDLTRMDVAQRLRAFQEDEYGTPPNDEMKVGCLAIFEREKAEGTELPAIIGAIKEWVGEEELRQWHEREAARQKQIEEDRIALEQRFLSGADCKWTPVNKSAEVLLPNKRPDLPTLTHERQDVGAPPHEDARRPTRPFDRNVPNARRGHQSHRRGRLPAGAALVTSAAAPV